MTAPQPSLPPSARSLALFSVHRYHPRRRPVPFRAAHPLLPFLFPSLPPFLPFPALPLPCLVVCAVARWSRDRSRACPGPFRFSMGLPVTCFFSSASVKGRFLSCPMVAFSRVETEPRLKTSGNSSSRSFQIDRRFFSPFNGRCKKKNHGLLDGQNCESYEQEDAGAMGSS